MWFRLTYSALVYVAANRMLEDKRKCLFWFLCAAYCLDLILSNVSEITVFRDTIAKAKRIIVFSYRYSLILNLF